MSDGEAGAVHGGDRLPWIAVEAIDNYGSLEAMSWQVHVYGGASPKLVAWCEAHNLPLHVFAWRSEYEEVGFAPNALYLLRPDTYVALADASGSVDALQRYFTHHQIQL